ncbi:MAG: hypothetical protein L6Q37_09485 [Bdellovibrionaceae bacterium]|nr:hypothetical protein [Pseudobdellovibrionaceae bacterium]NUM59214.1 hypothetical protein [Pseudobdellovibrionaceae bacterium]
MIKSLVLLFFGITCLSFADPDVTTTESNTEKKNIESSKLRYKIEVQGQVLVFDSKGKKLLFSVDEERKWRFGNEKPISSYWQLNQKGLPDLHFNHEWQLSESGILSVKFKQYDSMKRISEDKFIFGKTLQEKELEIENFQAPVFVLSQEPDRRIVVQFRVQVWSDDDAKDIGKLAINSTRMTIFDSKGNLWASRIDNSSGDNVYYGITTYLGSLYISYLPFKGASKIGIAEKNRIRIEHGKTKLSIESSDAFLPRGVVANVYGFIDLNHRTEGLNRTRSNGSDKEENFLKSIKR